MLRPVRGSGMVVLHFIGAGLFGFAHTLPQINYYTPGNQVAVSYGHLSFYGAGFVLLSYSLCEGFVNRNRHVDPSIEITRLQPAFLARSCQIVSKICR
jgi:nitric oxide reductase large subunit